MFISILALIRETFLEALSKKVFIVYLLIATVILILLGIFVNLSSAFDAEALAALEPSLRKAAMQEAIFSIQSGIGTFFFVASVLFSLFITANIIPSMMEKGAIDLYLSKPISREILLLGKLFGGFMVAASGVIYFNIGSFILIGITTGVWNSGYVLSLLPVLGTFLAFYAIVALFGCLTQSYAIGLIVSYLHIFILSPVLASRNELLFAFIESSFWQGVINTLHTILPQFQGMAEVIAAIIQQRTVLSWEPVTNMSVFSLVMIVATIVVFRRKEF